jgi:hypothetical protein
MTGRSIPPWVRRLVAVLVLLALVLSGPRALYGMFVPFIQLMGLGAPLFIVIAWLSRPWRRPRRTFQEFGKKMTDFWKHY